MKIGILTFTDGRARVAKATDRDCHQFQERLAEYFRGRKHEVVTGRNIVWNHETARNQARKVALAYPDVVVFNFCVWSFPDLTAQAANLIPDVPIILVGNMLPSHPGWVAFFASAGTLEEVGRPFGRVLGDIREKRVQADMDKYLHRFEPDARVRGERAAALLLGLRYGEFDGPSMGMYTGHIDPSQWMEQFGVHVYHRGQLHLWEIAKRVADERVEAGLAWLEKHCAEVHWDGAAPAARNGESGGLWNGGGRVSGRSARAVRGGRVIHAGAPEGASISANPRRRRNGSEGSSRRSPVLTAARPKAATAVKAAKLTPGLNGTLARQVRMYLAMKDFCRQEGIDFCGLTGQLDMTEWPEYCIADVQEALLNDTADWENERKKPIICATECDSNGALTMQIMHHLSETPVLFADLRHYHEREGLYDLVNSGQHAPWFAKRSDDFRRNWREIHLRPALDFYFRGGGASVQFYAAPAERVTFGRITRRRGHFVMHLFTGSFAKLPRATEERLARMTTLEWPHAFARFDCPLESIRDHYASNHIHAIVGDHVGALVAACEMLGIEPVVLS